MQNKIIFCLLFLLCLDAPAFAHRINFETELHAPAVTVKAFFSRTAPVANARVDIYAPDSSLPFQTGRTDNGGNFAFLPDNPGTWKAVIDDERGHTGQVLISIHDGFFESPGNEAVPETVSQIAVPQAGQVENASSGVPLLYRVIFGLSVILNITALAYVFRIRQEINSREGRS
jgi:nickel transport protein